MTDATEHRAAIRNEHYWDLALDAGSSIARLATGIWVLIDGHDALHVGVALLLFWSVDNGVNGR